MNRTFLTPDLVILVENATLQGGGQVTLSDDGDFLYVMGIEKNDR